MPTKKRQPKNEALADVIKGRLEELRNDKNLNHSGFAAAARVPRPVYNSWRNSGRVPGGFYLRLTAEAFKVTTDWLLGVEGAPKYRGQVRERPELTQDVGHHVSREVMSKVIAGRPLHETFAGDLLGWRYDGQKILDLAVAREVEHLRSAFRGYDAAAEDVRSQFGKRPFRGGTERQRRADDSRVGMLVKHAIAAIAVSRFESDKSGLVRADQSRVAGAIEALGERRHQPVPSESEPTSFGEAVPELKRKWGPKGKRKRA